VLPLFRAGRAPQNYIRIPVMPWSRISLNHIHNAAIIWRLIKSGGQVRAEVSLVAVWWRTCMLATRHHDAAR